MHVYTYTIAADARRYYLFLLHPANNKYVESAIHLPQMKHVFFRVSSLCCFSVLRSANVSMITPKIRLSTITMTTK